MCEFLQNAPSGRVELTRDEMFLSRDDIDRLAAAANLDLRTFLRKLESSSELGKALAQRIRNTRRWLRPVSAEEAFLLATVLNLKRETIEALCKEEPFDSKLACMLFNYQIDIKPFSQLFQEYPQIFEMLADAVARGISALKGVVLLTGRAIAQERRAQGLTQYELARLARLSRSRLANIETGRFSLKSPAAARNYDRDVQKLIRTLEKRKRTSRKQS
jgi:DNA-binding XRE family transcriptional regulator